MSDDLADTRVFRENCRVVSRQSDETLQRFMLFSMTLASRKLIFEVLSRNIWLVGIHIIQKQEKRTAPSARAVQQCLCASANIGRGQEPPRQHSDVSPGTKKSHHSVT